MTRRLAFVSSLAALRPRLLECLRQLGDDLLRLGGRLPHLVELPRCRPAPTNEEDERDQKDERHEGARPGRRPGGAIADIALPSNGS